MSTTARTLFMLALGLAATSSATADSRPAWDASRMSAAATYFPKGSSVMVVGVGAQARTPSSVLLASLQRSSELELAIDARALGKVDDLSDQDLVKRAFARPIQRVAIVRVFASAGSSKAVVTVYGAQGQVTAAFTLAPGRALVENDSPEAAELGVNRDQLANVQGVTGTMTSSSSDAEIQYERHEIVGVSAYGVVSFEHVRFSKGGKEITDIPELFDAMGMADRAHTYRERKKSYATGRERGGLLMTFGTLGAVSFGTWALASAAVPDCDYETNTCSSNITLPLLLTGGSLAVAIAGYFVFRSHEKPEQVSLEQAITMVDEYNAKKHRTTARAPLVRDVHIAPSAMPSGGGIILGGTF